MRTPAWTWPSNPLRASGDDLIGDASAHFVAAGADRRTDPGGYVGCRSRQAVERRR
ncbi:MAG: hypothetical protein AAF657_06855 [Acidobacteriota bacterium]